VDAAQTGLEAYMHLADRVKKVTSVADMRALERFDHEGSDTGAAEEHTELHIVTMAEGQPTPLANERGLETENRPLNTTEFRDEELELGRAAVPSDEAVPKTRRRAGRRAKELVPDLQLVLKEAAIQSDPKMEENEAVEIVRATNDDIRFVEDGEGLRGGGPRDNPEREPTNAGDQEEQDLQPKRRSE
jgi:hypothetical protein